MALDGYCRGGGQDRVAAMRVPRPSCGERVAHTRFGAHVGVGGVKTRPQPAARIFRAHVNVRG